MSAENVRVDVQSLSKENASLVLITDFRRNRNPNLEHFSDKESALKNKNSLHQQYRLTTFVIAGISIGSIVAGIAILLKDKDIGPIQATSGALAVAYGDIFGWAVLDRRNKAQIIDKQISALQEFDNSKNTL